jgi:hypothetical protein
MEKQKTDARQSGTPPSSAFSREGVGMPSMRRFVLRRYRLFVPYLLRHGLLILLVLLLGDGLATLCFPQIKAALSLSTLPTPALTARITAPNVAALANGSGTRVLASDTFQRPDQRYWGTASDSQAWQADASNEHNFVIFKHVGVIEATPQHVYCNALLGPEKANVEITFNAALSQYGTSLLSAVLRWSDANNFYALTFDGQKLALDRVMDGMQIPLQSVAFPARAGAFYTFRFRASGAQLFAMVWPTGQPAPSDWQISASDSALNNGQAGLRALVQNGTQARITAYEEVQL